jgi:hypothetical protein
MRLSYRTHILRLDDGRPYGLFAEADFCAEHEHGLSRLHQDMGCGDLAIEGIGRYQPSEAAVSSGKVPFTGTASFWYRNEKGRKCQVKRRIFSSRKSSYLPEDGYLPPSSQHAVVSFSDHGFMVVSRTDELDAFLDLLEERAKERDIAVFMGGAAGNGNPFNRGGLVIAIPSLVPEAEKETLRASHENARLLEEAAARTGIRERIDAKMRETSSGGWTSNSPYRLYGIKPDWAPGSEARTEVHFFINNGRGIYGWYTVADLDDWLAGHGKVLEDEKGRKTAAA